MPTLNLSAKGILDQKHLRQQGTGTNSRLAEVLSFVLFYIFFILILPGLPFVLGAPRV